MSYVDHQPATWFLVERRGTLYLDARYSYSGLIDDSALIELTDSEHKSFRAGGHDYLTDLARRVHHSAPYRDESAYYERDLYRGTDGAAYRREVSAAIVDHTWIAEQRRSAGD